MDKVLNDKKLLTKILLDERRSRDFQATLMWENIKFFATLISGLITAEILLLQLFLNIKVGWPALFVVPVLVIVLSYVGEKDLRRRWSRLLEAIANSAKMEFLLGLHTEIPKTKRVFPEDKYMFPDRWFESRRKYASSAAFVKCELKADNMYTHMRKIYFFTIAFGVLLVLLSLALLLMGRFS